MIEKMQKFYIKDIEVFSFEDFSIENKERGLFILDMWNQCEESNINVLPVKYVEYSSLQELYILKTDNVVVGKAEDIWLK